MFLKKRKKWIKLALKIRNVSQKELARELKITESYLTRLIDGTRYSKTFEEWLEKALCINYANL